MTKQKPAPKKRKRGRPSRYTPELAAVICERFAEGETLRSVCRDKAMPDKATVLRWLGDKKKADFRDQYAHARDSAREWCGIRMPDGRTDIGVGAFVAVDFDGLGDERV